jgi:hypothetical protein
VPGDPGPLLSVLNDALVDRAQAARADIRTMKNVVYIVSYIFL